jgi:hypothetical protein
MTLLVDACYTIGKMHLFCQDYASRGSEPVPHVILADGCSAAPDSDLGARLLALDARCLLRQFAREAADRDQQALQYERLGRRIVRRAARQVRELGLDPAVLDATLLVAWCHEQTVSMHLYGDGCIAAQRADGTVVAIEIEYAENAPYYLSYRLDPERGMLYQAAVGDSATAQRVRCWSETGVTIRREPFDTPLTFSFDLAMFPRVLVATDGLHSFVNVATQERLEVLAVARELLNFHPFDGTFVQRRLGEVLAGYRQQGVLNIDDIGVGAFVAPDEDWETRRPPPQEALA